MLIMGLIVLSASRLGLVIWKFERVVSTDKLAEILLQGVRVDIHLYLGSTSISAHGIFRSDNPGFY